MITHETRSYSAKHQSKLDRSVKMPVIALACRLLELVRPFYDLDLRQTSAPAQKTKSDAFAQRNILLKCRRTKKTPAHHGCAIVPRTSSVVPHATIAAREHPRPSEGTTRYGRRTQICQHDLPSPPPARRGIEQ